MKHRTDIDGLRAVAVLPVVAFHAGISFTPGGFVGVDVFFVISGFLITGIVAEELGREGGFSLAGFYERRIRRIFPALFAMLALTALAVSLLLTAGEVVAFARTLLAAVYSGSNILFWLESDYFDQSARQMPLLHTWSLAVEEQFYLIMPLALALLWRRRPKAGDGAAAAKPGGVPARVKLVLAGVLLVSFAWGWWGSLYQPTASFYLLHTRAWELALGALLALGAVPPITSRLAREAVSAAGLAAIGLAVLFYTDQTPFPGVAALAPCLGAAALLHAGARRPGQEGPPDRTWTAALLSLRPVVFIGLISYSLYLWHWPVIVLQRASFVLGEGLDPKLDKAVMIAVSLLLGWLSWLFVERPFRNRAWLSRRSVFLAGGAGALALSAVAGVLIAAQGFPSRLSPQANRTAGFLAQDPTLTMKHPACLAGVGLRQAVDEALCLTGSPGKPNVLLLGDSHAAHLWNGLAASLPEANLLQATAGGCRPAWPTETEDVVCRRLLTRMFEDWLPANRPDVVLLAARWEPQDAAQLERTLKTFRRLNIPVVVIGPVPRYDLELPRLLIAAQTRADPGLPQRHLMALVPNADQRLAAMTTAHRARYISLYRALCPAGSCRTWTPAGAPIQYDGGHLTLEGGRFLGGQIRPELRAALASARAARAPPP